MSHLQQRVGLFGFCGEEALIKRDQLSLVSNPDEVTTIVAQVDGGEITYIRNA
jgi:hypothetical protein